MTLIVFGVTTEYAVLASDRRMVTMIRGVPLRQEDTALKTFFLRGQLLMGYTGLAMLDDVSMEQWVAERLGGVTPNEVPGVLRDEMQAYYRRHPEVAGIPHHFRLAGFAYNPEKQPDRWPIGYEIGNCDWRAMGDVVKATNVTDEFHSRQNVFGNRVQAVGAVGSPYSLRSLQALEGKVRQARRANPMDPSLVFDAIVKFMRGVARRSKGMVGETILITSVPREAVPVHTLGWTVPASPEGLIAARTEPFAMMVPAGSHDRISYLPAIIHPEIQITGMTLERHDLNDQ